MNGLIVVNQEIGHSEYKIKRLNEEFSTLGVTIDVRVNDGTLFKIENGSLGINLPKYDFVIYLDKDIYLARALEKAGYRLFDNADFIKLCDDKMLTNVYLAEMGIRMPKTMAAPLFYSKNLENKNLTFIDDVISYLGLPLVFKRVYGSLGEGVFLVNSKEEFKDLYVKYCRDPLLFQEYIQGSYGKSVRVLVIDNQIVGAFLRTNKCDFRSNYGNKASSEKIENPEKYYDFVRIILKIMDIEYAGIDLLLDENDTPYFCEMNSNAFFEEFEKVTNINVARLYAQMIIRKVQI